MENINDSYFDGVYKEIWRSIIPETLTQREIDFIISYFNLKSGDEVLDLMCGYGRHSIALARRGIHVTAVDNLESYIFEIRDVSKKEDLPIEAICGNVLTYSTQKKFDLAICMGNSLNFYNEENTMSLLKKVSQTLHPGGKFLINTWSIAEIVFNNFQAEGTGAINGIQCKIKSHKFDHPLRIESISTFILPDGNTESKLAIDYIFSIPELELMLEKAGMKQVDIYSVPGRKKFSIGDPRAYIVTEKID